jgi:RHS repeat-associated protein
LADGSSIDPYLNPRLYGGYWYDKTLNQYFMKVRMYDPEIGRFMAPDSETTTDSALSYNPYLYCANNPISRIDPSGKFAMAASLALIPFSPWIAAVVVVAGALILAGYGIYSLVNYYADTDTTSRNKGSSGGSDRVSPSGPSSPESPPGGGNDGGKKTPKSKGNPTPAKEPSSPKPASELGNPSGPTINSPVFKKATEIVIEFTKHGINQVVNRMSPRVLLNTMKNPRAALTAIGRYGKPVIKLIGSEGTVIINEVGKIITVIIR